MNCSSNYSDYSKFSKKNSFYTPCSPQRSCDSKSDSTKLSSSSFSDDCADNKFENSNDKIYDEEELEKCLLSDLLKVLEESSSIEEGIEQSNKFQLEENSFYFQIEPKVKLNVDEPSFYPKSYRKNKFKVDKKEDKDDKDLVLIKKPKKKTKAKNSDKGKNKKAFNERDGDWCCYKCKNINFSFRRVCNRCKISRNESDSLTENAIETIKKIYMIADH